MKQCGYCGRDNQNEAAFCNGCGTELAAEIPVTTTESARRAVEPTADTLLELQRCRNSESLTELTSILDAAGITYERSSLTPMYDISKIGAGDTGDHDPVIVRVPQKEYDAARAAMESAYLKTPLPENHYLLTSTDEELAEIVGQSSEWSAFDVAHARRLIGERGIATDRIEEKRAAHLRQLQLGKAASKKLILLGCVSSILGGVIGFGIGWSLCYMKEKTPDGEFFTYHEKSRSAGEMMMMAAAVVIANLLLVLLSRLQSR